MSKEQQENTKIQELDVQDLENVSGGAGSSHRHHD
jgi:hypothetical protein